MNTENPTPAPSDPAPEGAPAAATPQAGAPQAAAPQADAPQADAPQADPSAIELPFQAEVQQVLALVINSLYTNQEVFLRELTSNASDALDKARFLALTREGAAEQVGEPKIEITLNDDARTLTIEDNGVGMTRDEVVQNLGTIARSGSLEFLKANAEAARKKEGGALQLIGQFGVGFYAAFMVAARVDVQTRSMVPGAEPVLWRSAGAGSFTVAPGDREHPGTRIVLHLKEDAREYTKAWRIKEIIRKYSDFVHFPITVNGEVANRSAALWTLPKSQITEEQHAEFFHHVTSGHEGEKPLHHVHLSIDAPVQFHALLYISEKASPDLFQKDRRGLRLYAKRVLIMEDCDKLTPMYLRFLRGVVDSEDLSLNVSREVLQENRTLSQIEQQIVKQVLRSLKDLSESDPDRYARFWSEFGRVFKEGMTIDWKNKDAITDLCRFEAMSTEAGKFISLRQYVDKMPEGQKEIYYVTGLSRRAVEQSAHLETFKKRGYDVLFLIDPVDEWVAKSMHEYDKRRMKSITHGDLDLGEEPEKKDEPAAVDAAVAAAKAALEGRVKDVRVSKRLTESASCLVAAEGDAGANFERIMKLMDQSTEESMRILELNASHPVVRNLDALAQREPGSERVRAWAELLFDQALLAEGVVPEPAKLVRKIQDLFTEVSNTAVKQQ